jgi:predicted site-specific integrase-resolvase
MAVSALVSSSENKDLLERQAERIVNCCNAKGLSVGKVVKECGDFVAMFTFMCAIWYGRRCAERKTERVLAAWQQNGSSHEKEPAQSD